MDDLTNVVNLGIHLSTNMYPPVHPSWLPHARWAIERANEGDFSSVRELPSGKNMTVATIIEGLHLESFVDWEEE